ncbi:hypothetical protein ETH_00036645 [Eimeria tenella]|uniref:Uncharacterized protein n=1 Tax=Eimeria tenella TaxID=5802 RepID=U6KSX3_EIMTE|nr:hypothetical protein ETH_00036645 [Eimeria tenella]CDJ40018.1 hypothetical protein ETH_00036645 [Eimeria tenella]|eukprot:XP_013230771.1 hypothetical protein ETH_00036645 [Eimeria tenella]
MPAVATPRVFQSLLESGKQLGIPLRQGIALTNGLFYGHGKEHIENLTNWSKGLPANEVVCESNARSEDPSAKSVLSVVCPLDLKR